MEADGEIAVSAIHTPGTIRIAGITLIPGATPMAIILIHTGIIPTGEDTVTVTITITETGTGITEIQGIVITDSAVQFHLPMAEETQGQLLLPIITGQAL